MKIPFINLEIKSITGLKRSADEFLKGGWDSMTSTKSGVSITKQNAMNIAGVYSSVRVITDALSSLPTHIIKDNGNTKEKLYNHPVYNLIAKEPNSLMTSFVYWQIVLPQILLWGNSYSIIEFAKGSFRPISILPVHPSLVTPKVIDGVLWYKVSVDGQPDLMLDQTNMLHFRGLGNEVVGKSVIDYAADNLGLGKASEDFGSAFFSNGATTSGVLQSDQSLSDKAIKNLRNSFNDTYGGISNSNKMMILEEGLKFASTSIPPDSAQFLETRKFSINDIARWFKLPPHMIGDLERATFSNIEQQDLNFVKHSILPYVINIEQELNRKLLRETEKKNTYFKMNLDGLLRGDIKTRSEAYKVFIQNGVMTPNEARGKEEMNPKEGGDNTWMPLNLAPIDQSGTNQKIESDEKN